MFIVWNIAGWGAHSEKEIYWRWLRLSLLLSYFYPPPPLPPPQSPQSYHSTFLTSTLFFLLSVQQLTSKARWRQTGDGRHETTARHSSGLYQYYRPQNTYINRVQSSVWRLSNLDPPPPLPLASVSSPRTKGGGKVRRWRCEGVGESIFRKTPDIGLAPYSIIPLRLRPSTAHSKAKLISC